MQDLDLLLEKQRLFFQTAKTLDVNYRLNQLRQLKKVIQENEDKILQALYEDLGKSREEAYMCEIGLVYSEINDMMKHTKKWAKKKTVPTPLSQFVAHSYSKKTPYGNVLIMSPWNYPFLLTVSPLVNALAAGNTAIVKPSAYSPKTSAVLKKIISSCFEEEYVACILGGRQENSALLEKKFDFIFFTGSQMVGKLVLKSAANYLTPAVLELGGKSPCIVDETAKISLAAKRIVFGKFLNCGQTCVAPDYIICHESVKQELVDALIQEIKQQYSLHPLDNPNYGRIVNEKHFERLLGLISQEKCKYGGKSHREALKIEPTLLDDVTWEDAVMQEEIFGPILPILTYQKIEDVISLLATKEKPLALYIFSENKSTIDLVTNRTRYGGGCINDVIIHLATSHLGFGGVGESGMGAYHGKVGFDTFSHTKSIVDKKTWFDLPLRYQPYQKYTLPIVRFFMK